MSIPYEFLTANMREIDKNAAFTNSGISDMYYVLRLFSFFIYLWRIYLMRGIPSD